MLSLQGYGFEQIIFARSGSPSAYVRSAASLSLRSFICYLASAIPLRAYRLAYRIFPPARREDGIMCVFKAKLKIHCYAEK